MYAFKYFVLKCTKETHFFYSEFAPLINFNLYENQPFVLFYSTSALIITEKHFHF